MELELFPDVGLGLEAEHAPEPGPPRHDWLPTRRRLAGREDRAGVAAPVGRLDSELGATELRQRVELGAPVVLGSAPTRLDPTALFQAVQGRIEGAFTDRQCVGGGLLDAPRDVVPVRAP